MEIYSNRFCLNMTGYYNSFLFRNPFNKKWNVWKFVEREFRDIDTIFWEIANNHSESKDFHKYESVITKVGQTDYTLGRFNDFGISYVFGIRNRRYHIGIFLSHKNFFLTRNLETMNNTLSISHSPYEMPKSWNLS